MLCSSVDADLAYHSVGGGSRPVPGFRPQWFFANNERLLLRLNKGHIVWGDVPVLLERRSSQRSSSSESAWLVGAARDVPWVNETLIVYVIKTFDYTFPLWTL